VAEEEAKTSSKTDLANGVTENDFIGDELELQKS
jgi:hypothetical protein